MASEDAIEWGTSDVIYSVFCRKVSRAERANGIPREIAVLPVSFIDVSVRIRAVG